MRPSMMSKIASHGVHCLHLVGKKPACQTSSTREDFVPGFTFLATKRA